MDISRSKYDFLTKWAWKGKVLLITGARQVGKSTLMMQWLSNQNKPYAIYNADDPVTIETFSKVSLPRLKIIIGNNKILIIDEIQRIENAGLVLKMIVDNFKDVQVLASGSSSLEISEKIFEPLTGRHYNFHLFPMALNEIYKGKTQFEIKQNFAFHLVYGLYPEICTNRQEAQLNLKNLTAQYLYKDVLAWKDIRKPELLDKLLKLLAYQIGSEVSIHELALKLNVKSETVFTYIDLLEKSYVIFKLNAYSTNDRNEVTKMKKIYFYDTGIRNAVIGDFDPLEIRQDVGKLWENFMIAERMKANDNIPMNNIKSYFWRNLNQKEVDYVELDNKKLSAYEMKWNTHKKNYVSKAFTNAYPKAKTDVIDGDNWAEFCRVE